MCDKVLFSAILGSSATPTTFSIISLNDTIIKRLFRLNERAEGGKVVCGHFSVRSSGRGGDRVDSPLKGFTRTMQSGVGWGGRWGDSSYSFIIGIVVVVCAKLHFLYSFFFFFFFFFLHFSKEVLPPIFLPSPFLFAPSRSSSQTLPCITNDPFFI